MVIGGLAASTLVTLFLIPVIYVTAASLLDRVQARRSQSTPQGDGGGELSPQVG